MKRFLIAALFALPLVAIATEVPMFTLTIKDHRYQPTTLKVPADTKIKIKVINNDSTPEEFESSDFSREKIVMPNSSIEVFVGPLKAGEYKFFGDFHQDTAQGVLIAE
ncbi:cupredoxin domain-containing protein [Rhodanobacter sp. AS-Z3]|uniref:cupredoxin domain-containing protein n=1 Tax=Rhodanobacter sp. AS-Z3 TaxID=3031330 RepID=UPI00247A3241|nr:cupredoxin domain-containing protein [Rhodanobacter sp. AS-Z3]WEN16688.1 cupredoxin domain-containing protein [Rhodanobacter sp. AS-Z3]